MKLSYQKVLNQTITYYINEQYDAAYKYITKHQKQIIGNDAQIMNFRYAILCKMGKTDQALTVLKEAVLDNAYWYDAQYLLEDEDLASLRKNVTFQQIVVLCKTRKHKAQKEAQPKYLYENLNKEYTAIIVHGNQENNVIAKANWDIKALSRYNKLYIQSDQIEFSEGYVWDDISQGQQVIRDGVQEYQKQADIAFIGAFSAGASVILEMIKTHPLKETTIVLVAPWLPNMKTIENIISAYQSFRFLIVCGKNDTDCLPHTKHLQQLFNQNHINSSIKLIDGLDHAFPDNFNEIVQRFLNQL